MLWPTTEKGQTVIDSPHRHLLARLHPAVANAWTLIGDALDTRTADRARRQTSAWAAVSDVHAATTVLTEVADAQWHPALTVAATHLRTALETSDNGIRVRLAQQASSAVVQHWGELKAESDVRRVGAQLGWVLDSYLRAQPGPMMAQVWTELPLTDAFIATATSLRSRHPRTWTPGQAVAVSGAWEQLREALPLPDPSDPRLLSAQRVRHINGVLELTRMLLAACSSPPSPGQAQVADRGVSAAGPPVRHGTAGPGSPGPGCSRAVTVSPVAAYSAVRAAGALLSHLLAPDIECEHGPLVSHWTANKSVLHAWVCLEHAAHDYPTPQGRRAVWSTVRGLTLPHAAMATAVGRYMRLDWRGARFYARQVIERAEPHLTSSPRAAHGGLPSIAIDESCGSADTPAADPRAGPDLA
jgi:hypothetical protein